MSLFDDKKKELEIEDTIKILSTNLEVLNAKLASTQGYGMEEFHSSVEKQVTEIGKKIESLTKTLTTFDSQVRELILQDKDAVLNQVAQFNQSVSQVVTRTNSALEKIENEVSEMKTALKSEFVLMRQILVGMVNFNKDVVSYLKDPSKRPVPEMRASSTQILATSSQLNATSSIAPKPIATPVQTPNIQTPNSPISPPPIVAKPQTNSGIEKLQRVIGRK